MNRIKQFLKDTENRWLEIRMTRIVKKICKEKDKPRGITITHTYKGTL